MKQCETLRRAIIVREIIDELERTLEMATEMHLDKCAYYETQNSADCNCDAQTDGADLCMYLCQALARLRRELAMLRDT